MGTNERDDPRELVAKFVAAIAYEIEREELRQTLVSLLMARVRTRLSVFDHGPGRCEVAGCPQERYRWESTGHHSNACAIHAWERILGAVARDDEDPRAGPRANPHARPHWEFMAAKAFARWVYRLSKG